MKDQAVITSWGQTGFAHYSGVSRTLSAADDDTLCEVLQVLETVSQPFIDAEVMALARHGQALSSQRYAGPAQSAECLQAAVRKMEQVLGLHPRRRTEQVPQRLQTLATCQARLQASRR